MRRMSRRRIFLHVQSLYFNGRSASSWAEFADQHGNISFCQVPDSILTRNFDQHFTLKYRADMGYQGYQFCQCHNTSVVTLLLYISTILTSTNYKTNNKTTNMKNNT